MKARVYGAALALLAAASCARGVNDYLAEARTGEPQAVREAVKSIGEILQRKEDAELPLNAADQEALAYIKDVAFSNQVAVNRAGALGVLSRLRRAAAGDTFRAGIKDSFWLARLQAVQGMERQSEEAYAEPLRELLVKETRPEVRQAAINALGHIRSPLALKTLLEVFLHRGEGAQDPQVLAYPIIKEMTGLHHGFEEVTRWQEYYTRTFGEIRKAPDVPPLEDEGE